MLEKCGTYWNRRLEHLQSATGRVTVQLQRKSKRKKPLESHDDPGYRVSEENKDSIMKYTTGPLCYILAKKWNMFFLCSESFIWAAFRRNELFCLAEEIPRQHSIQVMAVITHFTLQHFQFFCGIFHHKLRKATNDYCIIYDLHVESKPDEHGPSIHNLCLLVRGHFGDGL